LKPVYILNGPNLNLLGVREPEIYGRASLADAEALAAERAKALGLAIVFRQSNHEGVLVDWIQEARGSAAALILNAGAYTHTSLAIHDALKAFPGPIIELHVSNPAARENFRRHSYVSRAATGCISGFGINGYALAVEAVHKLLAA
jgi:3-dehydroquinate dehydratase-2